MEMPGDEGSSSAGPLGRPPSSDDLDDAAMMRRVAGRLFDEAPAPVTIGRFVVESTIGAGGMGVVVLARDPKLGRRVAIKLLRSRADGDRLLAQRIEQEALALARLSHPNVVQVYEVGEHDGQVFLAMEHVDGGSLREWLAAERRSWREILDRYLQAGAGLAAAHRVGIVHRDFKPANALVGRDGRVRVADFGLARGVVTEPAGVDDGGRSPLLGASQESLTRSGAIVGTPAYMSPEQIAGQSVDVRSDVFSYCVALWEALAGARPYQYEQLRQGLLEGRWPPTTGRPMGPAWLRRALRRGLAVEAARRWSSMADLLVELERAPVRRRRELMGLGVVGLGLGGWVTWVELQPNPCPIAVGELVGIWDDERRAELEGVIMATGLEFAPQTWRLVEEGLDGYASAWLDARQDACEATKVHGRQSEEQLDLSVHCLDERLDHLSVAVDTLAEGRVEVVVEGVALVEELEPLEPCASTPHLRTVHERPLDRSPVARALDLRVAQAEAYLAVQLHAEAREVVDDAVDEARRLGDVTRQAKSLAVRGHAEAMLGQGTLADASLRESMVLALEVGDFELAARDWILLGRVAAVELEDPKRARDWLDQAEGFFEGQAPNREMKVELALARAKLDGLEGRHDEGVTALRALVGVLPAGDPEAIEVLGEMANLHGEAGDLQASDELYEQVIARLSARLGDGHPSIARWRLNQAINQMYAPEPDLERAWALCQGVLAQYRDVYGEHDRRLAGILVTMGWFAHQRGDVREAEALARRAVGIVRTELPEGHSERAGALALLANLAAAMGRYREALGLYRELVGEYVAGRNAVELPKARQNLAWLSCRIDDCRETQEQVDAARTEIDVDDGLHVVLDVAEGRARLERGDVAGSLLLLDAALRRANEVEDAPDVLLLPDIMASLAMAWWAQGDRDRARELSDRAREGYRALGRGWDVAALDGWMKDAGLVKTAESEERTILTGE